MRQLMPLIVLFGLTACAQPIATVATSSSGAATSVSGQDTGLTPLINAYRSSEGRGPVSVVPVVTAVSLDHAQDMVANGYVSHIGLDNTSPGDRLSAAGCSWDGVAENIAQGAATPEQAMQMWIASPGHRANLLGPNDQIGPSRVGNTWVLVFASGC